MSKSDLQCSFCGKKKDQTKLLIAGIDAHICEVCIEQANGIIIKENNSDESIKITLRFLSNEIRSDSLKIILHKKSCDKNMNCKTNIINTSTIKDELRSTILRKASLFEKTDKQKK